ncbi:rab GTPase-activating protein 1-like isoform X1 [Planococcus citri]|uniref:rab GTPase-activating protein 1-like isoform X1 n=1 Tax=Planococcus citri TaxID=170843 RepID=UPI0031F7AB43
MDDSVSVKSNDSATTSDEYEFVPSTANIAKVPLSQKNEQPILKIAGNGDADHLQKCLGEMLSEVETCSLNSKMDTNSSSNDKSSQNYSDEEQFEPLADVCQECTVFGCISYLGSAAINAPKSKIEILRNMAILNEQSSDHAIKVSLSIPNFADGVVVLYDANNNSVMARYDVQRITFFANGTPKSDENSCFAFTYLHGDTEETAIFQCHVFRCDIPEAVGQVSLCFGKAFQRPSNSLVASSVNSEELDGNMVNAKSVQTCVFEVGLEVKEDDGKGNFNNVPKDRCGLKLRTNVKKQICLSIQPIFSNETELEIERCFGVLVCPGNNVKHSDMKLLDMVSLTVKNEDDESQKYYVITGKWDPKEAAFESFNAEMSKYPLTVAVDLVIKRIKEPIRLTIETQVKMYPQNERFWSLSKAQIYHEFCLYLKEVCSRNGSLERGYEVINVERSRELDKGILNHTWNNFTSLIRSASTTSLEGSSQKDEFSDTDEPIISGTGKVSKECLDKELDQWNDLLAKWTDTKTRPRTLTTLVRQGIPEALRGEVWQRLTINEKDDELLNNYRILISKECSAELVIQRDIHRTFPAHDFFKDAGGVGQDTLFNISKAYAVYDTEIGYCQGLTFIAASLLLHMPEEQAFCVLVRLMYDYKLRNLYKDGFENLNLRLYQLSRLLEEKEPHLWQHFKEMGIETHMFASHWFLTLYTARFPLYFVFYILDVVLVQGLDTLFQIALSLIISSKKELLTLDFENILKFFQATLPKKCRKQRYAKKIITRACNIKLKKLKKYEDEFIEMKAIQENAEQYNDELDRLQKVLARTEDEKRKKCEELSQAKEALFLEMQKREVDTKRDSNIIKEYKQICQRLDKELNGTKTLLNVLQNTVSRCDKCRSSINDSDSTQNGLHSPNINNNNKEEKEEDVKLSKQKELELELAQTKLALVEAECRNQDLTHQLNSLKGELQAIRNTCPPWLHKTLSSIKEVTANKRSVNTQNVANKLISMTTKPESIIN